MAITNGRNAIGRFNAALLSVARAAWPDRWARLVPRPTVPASRVGCEYRRTDRYRLVGNDPAPSRDEAAAAPEARAGLVSHGLALAHTHVRLNAAQIRDVIRRRLGITDPPEDPAHRRALFTAMRLARTSVRPALSSASIRPCSCRVCSTCPSMATSADVAAVPAHGASPTRAGLRCEPHGEVRSAATPIRV
ncbi:MAG: hypothetical protein M0002_16130 [Rhodospirillales bacterium]|nr:hypothetical protein [Rhodospirillales bacterium]